MRVTSVGGQRLPTCGLVLGEVTLLGEEGVGEHLKSIPALQTEPQLPFLQLRQREP